MKQFPVTNQTHNVSSPIQHRFAVRAFFEVSFHAFAHLGRDFLIKVVGDFPPHFYATDFNYRHLDSSSFFTMA
jgi:hypothetical protein